MRGENDDIAGLNAVAFEPASNDADLTGNILDAAGPASRLLSRLRAENPPAARLAAHRQGLQRPAAALHPFHGKPYHKGRGVK